MIAPADARSIRRRSALPLRWAVFSAIGVVLLFQTILIYGVWFGGAYRGWVREAAVTRKARVTGVTTLLSRGIAGHNYANVADREALEAYASIPGLRAFRARGTTQGGQSYEVFYDANLGEVVRGAFPMGHGAALADKLSQVRDLQVERPEDPKLSRVEGDLQAALDRVLTSRRESLRLRRLFPDGLGSGATFLVDGGQIRIWVPAPSVPDGYIEYLFDAEELDGLSLRVALQTLGPLVASVAAGLLVAMVLSWRIVRPLVRLTHSLSEDLVTRPDRRVACQERVDEVGTLARQCQRLVERNRALIRGLEAHNVLVQDAIAAKSVLLDHIDQPLLTIDLDGVVQPERSRAAEGVLGAIPEGATLAEVVGALDPTAGDWIEVGWATVRQGQIPAAEALAHLPNRFRVAERSYALRVTPIGDGRFLVVATNVTEEDASRAKSVFLASMSHELRTPLNAVIGYADLVLEDLADDQGPDPVDIERIRGAGKHLLGLVNQILDLSRIEAGKISLDLCEVDLSQIAQEVCDTLRTQIGARGNRLVLDLDGVPRVVADPLRVRQIVTNLVGNAAKFTRGGTLRVAVTAFTGGIEVMVADTGPGIPADRLVHIFEPFEQADPSIQHTYGGTGLGLAISRRLAEEMQAELSVTSEIGRGTCFVLRFWHESAPGPRG